MLSDMNLIQEVIWSSLSSSHQKRAAVCFVVFYNIGPPVGGFYVLVSEWSLQADWRRKSFGWSVWMVTSRSLLTWWCSPTRPQDLIGGLGTGRAPHQQSSPPVGPQQPQESGLVQSAWWWGLPLCLVAERRILSSRRSFRDRPCFILSPKRP